MRRNYRRRNRGTWLPVLDTVWQTGAPGTTFDGIFQFPGSGPILRGQRIALDVIPLTYDFTQTNANADSDVGVSLRDLVEGQEYLLDRVVGKVYCDLTQDAAGSLASVICCAALAVLPVDDDTNASSLEAVDTDPLLAQNSMQPWMWRRTWLLGNNLTTQQYSNGRILPASNTGYGSVAEGTHLDTKGVKRRIRKEQRIFLVLSSYCLEQGEEEDPTVNAVRWEYDLRLHGSMRKARNQSTFK